MNDRMTERQNDRQSDIVKHSDILQYDDE